MFTNVNICLVICNCADWGRRGDRGGYPVAGGEHVFLYRDLPDEVEVPGDIPIIYRDEKILVVDKPHFLATVPRGSHVVQTAVVRLRRELYLPELSPAHRLNRLTAGVLLFTVRPEVRGAYQTLFARGEVRKVYLARAGVDSSLVFPLTLRSRIIKDRSRLPAFEVSGEPNTETFVEHLGDGLYRLTPRTGRTHQLRVHMASLGLPIHGDPLYPAVTDVTPDDFSTPLQLLARTLEFDDPLTGKCRRFLSRRSSGEGMSSAGKGWWSR
ncbi:RNA pseudouridine synthase [Mycolicibacterium insubricum]|jgi:tRNA pseudouridine32 synthase/23S rRNA pseudouridine746 synthase|nr:pseudouridine synthase [Mycolicibacterium insubricum]BBZ66130.1 RNA pseudouridine synthase [Mycolicibacterium insubricum]